MRALRQTLVQLRRRGAATALAVGLLALGVGFSVAFYSVLDSALLRGLPFPGGDRMVAFSTEDAAGWPMPLDDYRAIEQAQLSFDWVLPLRTFNVMATRGDRTKALIGSYVPAALFQRLGVEPVIGRGFTAEDEDPASPAVALISYRLWHGSYGGDPAILGEEITVNRERCVVVGVMPAGFRFPLRHDVWSVFGRPGRGWEESQVFGFGLLSRGSTVATARQDLERIAAFLDQERPLPEARKAEVESFVRANIGDRSRGALRAMVFAAFGLLALTCANLANLRLGESLRRSAELDTRLALGARPSGLVKLLLLENLVLGICATALGLLVAFGLIEVLGKSLLSGSYLERIFWIEAELDLRAAGFAAACALAASLVGALAPIASTVLRVRSGRLGDAGGSRSRTAPWSRGLVGLQVGMCFALLVAAGLWTVQATALLDSEPGFDPVGLSSTQLSSYQARLEQPEERRELFERLRRELDASPQIVAAAYSSSVPWSWARRGAVSSGDDEPDRELAPQARIFEVSPGFFSTLRLDLLAGRPFLDGDAADSSTAIISRGLAERLFERGALDRTLSLADRRSDQPARRLRIVGVVADLDVERADERDPDLAVYLPALAPAYGTHMLIRRQAGVAAARPALEEVLQRTAPLVGIFDEQTAEGALASRTWEERRLGQIFSLFAIASLLLTVAGIYAVIALMVRSRERELGIRAAVGAAPGDLVRLVLGESGRQLVLGLLAGVGALWAGSRLLDQVLVEGLEIRPAVVVIAAAVVALASLAASWQPARNAARTDPTRCLDSE